MKYPVALLLALLLHNVSFSAEGEVQEPLLTITGHYRSADGRVKKHKFPIEFKLRSDGSFDGTIESWVEAELTDGNSRLDYYNAQATGMWTIKDNAIHIVMQQEAMVPQIVFEKMNGLLIKIDKKQAPNKVTGANVGGPRQRRFGSPGPPASPSSGVGWAERTQMKPLVALTVAPCVGCSLTQREQTGLPLCDYVPEVYIAPGVPTSLCDLDLDVSQKSSGGGYGACTLIGAPGAPQPQR